MKIEIPISDQFGIKRKLVYEGFSNTHEAISDRDEAVLKVYIDRYENDNGEYGTKLTDNPELRSEIRQAYSKIPFSIYTGDNRVNQDGTPALPNEQGVYPEGSMLEIKFMEEVLTPAMLSVALNKPEWANINIPIGSFVKGLVTYYMSNLANNGKFD